MDEISQSELQAMNKDLLKRIPVWTQILFSTEVRDREDVLNSDMLSMYDQDDLLQLAFVAKEKLAELETLYHFAHEVSEYQ
jgi:hypothetical protein